MYWAKGFCGKVALTKMVRQAMVSDDTDGKNDVQPLWMLNRCISNYRAQSLKIRNRTVTIRYQTGNNRNEKLQARMEYV
ncbi:hypothetical protein A7975_22725 [Bacillus sp. FJAT-26390]|nr:hypothetical protein A7975_22725 [Bacillus sp. FJAT-26390]